MNITVQVRKSCGFIKCQFLFEKIRLDDLEKIVENFSATAARARIFNLLKSPEMDSKEMKESIPPAYVASGGPVRINLFLLGS